MPQLAPRGMKWFFCAGFILFGCEGKIATEAYRNSSGSLALSRDDSLLYAVDTDSNQLFVVDAATQEVMQKIPVGRSPTHIVVAPDDTLYVSNRMDRSVSVIRRGAWGTVHRLEVGVEPQGLALSENGRTLYIVNSASTYDASVGTVLAVDTDSLQPTWELEVGPEPRAIVVMPQEKAFVSLYHEGDVVQIDLKNAKVVQARTDLYARANATGLDSNSQTSDVFPRVSTYRPRAVAALAATPNGERLFAPVTWSREDAIVTPPNAFGGYYASGGPCGAGSVVSPGVLTFDFEGNPQVRDVTDCTTSSSASLPPTQLANSVASSSIIQGASAMVVDPSGTWLFVANKESNNVAIFPTSSGMAAVSTEQGVFDKPISVGAGPDGLALTRDGKKAYVYSQFDHRIDTLMADGQGASAKIVNTGRPIFLASDVLPMDVVLGRKLFFDATTKVMSASGTHVACSSCHLDGREDGHVWNFPDGPRQTPSLAGRAMMKTAPFHWNGEFENMKTFMEHTVKLRMGGEGLSADQQRNLEAFLEWLPPADNPHRPQNGVLNESQTRGQAVFEKAQCGTCHSGDAFTNNGFADVGTRVRDGSNPDKQTTSHVGFNVPSLLSLARTAPYLHDGSASTLKIRIVSDQVSNQHGKTSGLTNAEVDDLVEYLKTL